MPVTTIAVALIALVVIAFATRRVWRAFIRTTDREIEKSLRELRERGILNK